MKDDNFEKQVILTDRTDTEDFSKQPEVGVEAIHYGIAGCTMSMLSTIIGVGIISIPYAASITGSMSIFVMTNIFCVVIMSVAAAMLL
jgi:hypothetical protein